MATEREKNQFIKVVRTSLPRDPRKVGEIQENRAVARSIVDDLIGLGYHIETLRDLRHQGKPWKTAIPVLVHWLPKIDNTDIKNEIVRCLSAPWVGNNITPLLIDEFKKYARANEILGWTIGNALSIVDVRGFEDQILELCKEASFGMARQMLVLSLEKVKTASAEDAALQLLKDDSVALHAVIALGKMRSRRAIPYLEKLSADKRVGIRREARKALGNLKAL